MSKTFIVTIPDIDIHHHGSHLNGQAIAKHIRQELRASGGHFLPGDWERDLLKGVEVKPQTTQTEKRVTCDTSQWDRA